MAYRQNYLHSEYMTPATIRAEFAVPTNGATTPVASGIRGNGATITRTGVGIMSVVFPAGAPGARLLEARAHLRLNAVGNTFAQVGGWNATTRTLLVNCVTGSGVAAEWPAADANNVLHIGVVFGDSAALPNRG
jgi:hypothetical protein